MSTSESQALLANDLHSCSPSFSGWSIEATGNHPHSNQYPTSRIGSLVHERQTLSSHDDTPFLHACQFSDSELVRLLLEQKADVHHTGAEGYPPIHAVARRYVHRQAKHIMAHTKWLHTCVGRTDHGAGPDTLAHIDSDDHNESMPILSLLLEARAEVNQLDRFGLSALHIAARGGHPAMVLRLLVARAHVNRLDKYGESALSMAIRRGRMRGASGVIALLTLYGASGRLENKSGETAWSLLPAHRRANVECVLKKRQLAARWVHTMRTGICTALSAFLPLALSRIVASYGLAHGDGVEALYRLDPTALPDKTVTRRGRKGKRGERKWEGAERETEWEATERREVDALWAGPVVTKTNNRFATRPRTHVADLRVSLQAGGGINCKPAPRKRNNASAATSGAKARDECCLCLVC